jgi:hypothetical protein
MMEINPDTHDCSGKNQKSNDENDTQENVVQSSDGSIEITHGRLETKPLSVNAKQSSLNLVSSRVPIAVLVQYLETHLRSL